MELEAITRQEQIIAGKDLQPVTRMEFFLKAYGGGGSGGGGAGVLIVNITEAPEGGSLVADKTVAEIIAAARTQLVFAQYSSANTSDNGVPDVIAGPLARIQTGHVNGVEADAVFFAGCWNDSKEGGLVGGIMGANANGVEQWSYYG